jgi:hypothetical protein
MKMETDYKPLGIRVSQSLKRLGYSHFQVSDLGEGQIKLLGSVPTEEDRAIVVAITRAVPGVRSVIHELP